MGKAETLALARTMLRTARKFSDSNFREYAQRRVLAGFRENAGLKEPAAIQAALADAREQLELLRRQTTVSQMYTHTAGVLDNAAPAWRVKAVPQGSLPSSA